MLVKLLVSKLTGWLKADADENISAHIHKQHTHT